MDDERIYDAKNRVFYSGGYGAGRNNPLALKTKSSSIYRLTGMSQIEDIIKCGYVRPKLTVRGGHKKEVFWSHGEEDLFYFDKSPVLEVDESKLFDGKMGALSINDLSAIWIFDEKENKYMDKLDLIKSLRQEVIDNSLEDMNKYKHRR